MIVGTLERPSLENLTLKLLARIYGHETIGIKEEIPENINHCERLLDIVDGKLPTGSLKTVAALVQLRTAFKLLPEFVADVAMTKTVMRAITSVRIPNAVEIHFLKTRSDIFAVLFQVNTILLKRVVKRLNLKYLEHDPSTMFFGPSALDTLDLDPLCFVKPVCLNFIGVRTGPDSLFTGTEQANAYINSRSEGIKRLLLLSHPRTVDDSEVLDHIMNRATILEIETAVAALGGGVEISRKVMTIEVRYAFEQSRVLFKNLKTNVATWRSLDIAPEYDRADVRAGIAFLHRHMSGILKGLSKDGEFEYPFDHPYVSDIWG